MSGLKVAKDWKEKLRKSGVESFVKDFYETFYPLKTITPDSSPTVSAGNYSLILDFVLRAEKLLEIEAYDKGRLLEDGIKFEKLNLNPKE